MAIEIKELVIKATVENLLPQATTGQSTQLKPGKVNLNVLVSEIVKRLNDKNER